jgi:outer membrane immunogenic protein
MKKLLFATTCLALTSTASMAADMSVPYTKAPVMAAPLFTWTGCYVGGHVGGGTMTSNFEGGSTNDLNGKGAVAGGQLGCNYQDGNFVFGLEGEGYWSNIKVSDTFTSKNNLGQTTFSSTSSLTNRDDFTIAARVGYAIDRTLIYAKGGWAWGSLRQNNFGFCCSVGSPIDTQTSSGNLDGFMVGVGIEHALTRNWTVKLEYDYIGFGNKEVPFTNCSGSTGICTTSGTSSFSATKQIFLVGANYLFTGGGAPLVAKY